MTDPNATLIAALLDRSGSMIMSKEATEDGWRELIDEQRQLSSGNCRVTLAQFDTSYEMVYAATPVEQVPGFVIEPRGRTALLDAVGTFVTQVGAHLSALPEDQRPGHVICVIMTDGMENASQTWTWEAVQKLTRQQRDEWNWKFIFIGANIDAIEVGYQMGFDEDTCITYDDSEYTTTMGVMRVAREMVRRTQDDEDAVFSEEDRRTAMGQTT